MKTNTRSAAFPIALSAGIVAVLLAGGCAATDGGNAYSTKPAAAPMTAPAITANEADDAGITQRVKAAIAADAGLGSATIGVQSYLRVVYLTGVAASAEQKARASALARSTTGAVDVTNNMTIKP